MRQLDSQQVVDAVARLCQEANFSLDNDVLEALNRAKDAEVSPLGREVLGRLLENAAMAEKERLPLCQDCGLIVVFAEVGQDVHISGDLNAAIEEGVRRGYAQGYLRRSVVRQPFSTRVNTGDNTPPIVHCCIVPGDRLTLTAMPKGGGAENMSRLAMLKPSDGRQGILDFVAKAVDEAGSNPCPPVIVGVGIGGNSEKAMLLAKRSLLRSVGQPSPDAETAALERDLLEKVNALGIGPQGFGGAVTALAVHVETFPTHIASLPVGVNLQCHSARHKVAVL